MEALSLYSENKSFRKTSKILQTKYKLKITRQSIMNWNKWMKTDINKICKKRMTPKKNIIYFSGAPENKLCLFSWETIDYCNNIILSKQRNFNIEILNDIRKLIINDSQEKYFIFFWSSKKEIIISFSGVPFINRNDIINTIFKKYNIKLTQNSISSIFKKLNLTRKKPRHYIVKSIDFLDKLIIKRNEFNKEISKIDINKIISIDEAGFNQLNSINKGLSEKGKRINVPISDKKIKNKSLICAVALDGIINNEIHDSSVNSIVFKNFIQNIINKLTTPNYYFIFDNVPFHHNKETLKLIIDSGHHYMFTPPYSPNNNPIETIFGIIKSNFRKEYKEKDNKNICILNLINNAVNKVKTDYNKERLTKIFNHSLKYSYTDL
jgi:transposase/glutaredoxin-related protein